MQLSSPDQGNPMRKDDPRCGVVLGCYRWPRLAEMNVRTIRQTCGDVPILLSVDPYSDERDARFLELEVKYPGVRVHRNLIRYGHGPGDLAALWKGIEWARMLGLQILAKISHRFLVLKSRWLQDGARELLDSGLPLASQRCSRDGQSSWRVRSEAMLLDVRTWSQPHVMQRLNPDHRLTQTYWSAEEVICDALAKTGRDTFHHWSLFGTDRNAKQPGILWHGANVAAEYQALASTMGIDLDEDFSIRSWWDLKDCPKGLKGSLSIIIPTLARGTLVRTLKCLVPQLQKGDEVHIVADGHRPLALEIARNFAAGLPPAAIRYHTCESDASDCYGAPQRNFGMRQATSEYLLFMDDDDFHTPDALASVRKAISENPGRPLLFRMQYRDRGHLWTDKEVRMGNVSTQMFCLPNVPQRLGRWTCSWANDFLFLCDTLDKWEADSLVWREEVISVLEQHRKGQA